MLNDFRSIPKKNFTIFFFFFTTLGFAADVDRSLKEMQKKYLAHSAVGAEFEQVVTDPITKKTKKSSGKILVQRPGKFRWETISPESLLLVSDGKRVWFYTPPFRPGEKGQVLIRKAADVHSKLAVDLLSGSADVSKDFRATRKDRFFSLKPLKPAGDVIEAELHIDPKTYLLYKVALNTVSGRRTEISIKNIKFDQKYDPNSFLFQPPQGVALDIEEQ